MQSAHNVMAPPQWVAQELRLVEADSSAARDQTATATTSASAGSLTRLRRAIFSQPSTEASAAVLAPATFQHAQRGGSVHGFRPHPRSNSRNERAPPRSRGARIKSLAAVAHRGSRKFLGADVCAFDRHHSRRLRRGGDLGPRADRRAPLLDTSEPFRTIY